MCLQAMNIILHGLPTNVYTLVNHQEAAKNIWDRVKMLMKGTELSYQERECRLYNLLISLLMVLDDLEAYDSDCDYLSLAKAVLMANLSSCDPKVLSEYKVNAAKGVNAASEEVSIDELVSTAYLKEFDLLKWDQQVVSELIALRNFARIYGSRFYTHGGCIQKFPCSTRLKFNSIKDAKLLLEAIEKRFGGNATTKKTQKNLLKQHYENFNAPSSEMLD
ncbi:hypothetical protein Tco_1025202 [Tanacetum coccineum]